MGQPAFSINGDFNLCNSDFMPCGLPMPSWQQSLWSDLFGLPTLPCSTALGPWCNGQGLVNPIMDATPGQDAFDLTNPFATFNRYTKDCFNQSRDSSLGKTVQFFSLLSLSSIDQNRKNNWGMTALSESVKTVIFLTAKYGGGVVQQLGQASKGAFLGGTAFATAVDLGTLGTCSALAGVKVASGG